MTRQEFIDEAYGWYHLIDFCSAAGCDICEDIYSDGDRDYEIEEDLNDMIRDHNWREILETLQDYDRNSGYEYYRRDEYGDWYGLDNNDFDQYKNDILAWADDNGIWNDDEGKSSQPYDTEDEVPLEDISFEELFA